MPPDRKIAVFFGLFGAAGLLAQSRVQIMAPSDVPHWLGPILTSATIFCFVAALIALFHTEDRAAGMAAIQKWRLRKPWERAEAVSQPQTASLAKQVYVGNITVSLNDFFEARRLAFTFACFNGSSVPLQVGDIKGSIELYSKPLPAPSLLSNFGRNILQFSEMYIEIEQKIPQDLYEIMVSSLEKEESIFIRFANLNVMLAGIGNANIRLPLWAGVTIAKRRETFATGRVIEASANIRC